MHCLSFKGVCHTAVSGVFPFIFKALKYGGKRKGKSYEYDLWQNQLYQQHIQWTIVKKQPKDATKTLDYMFETIVDHSLSDYRQQTGLRFYNFSHSAQQSWKQKNSHVKIEKVNKLSFIYQKQTDALNKKVNKIQTI